MRRRPLPDVPPSSGGRCDPVNPRVLGVDQARGVALMAVFVAHCAPDPGPGAVLDLSDHLAFPLFALLVGVGAELGARGATPVQHLRSSAVRGLGLLLLGWLLTRTGAQVVVVLAPLGVLTLACWALVRSSSPVVAAVGLLGWALAPWSVAATHDLRWRWMAEVDEPRLWLLDLVASTHYPQALLLACAATGILLVRWLLPAGGRVPTRRVLAGTTAALAVGSATLAGLDAMDRVALVAYGTTAVSNTFALLLASTVLCGCRLLGRGDRTARVLAAPPAVWLAWTGAMTLTLYTLHVGWLAYRATGLGPGELDDSWTDLVVLVVGAVAVAAGWRALRLPAGWGRGPLEGLLASSAAALWPGGAPGPGRAPARREPKGLTGAAREVAAEDGG